MVPLFAAVLYHTSGSIVPQRSFFLHLFLSKSRGEPLIGITRCQEKGGNDPPSPLPTNFYTTTTTGTSAALVSASYFWSTTTTKENMKKAPFQKLPYKAVKESTVLLVLLLVMAVVPELRMEDALEADACGAFPLVMDWVVVGT